MQDPPWIQDPRGFELVNGQKEGAHRSIVQLDMQQVAIFLHVEHRCVVVIGMLLVAPP